MRAWLTGLAMVLAVSATADEIDPRAENALTHIVLHELGHAVVREFDLPILGNEEVMADAFATAWLQAQDPDRAALVIADMASIWLHRVDTGAPDPWAEHPPFDRRARAQVCLLYGADPEVHAGLATEFGLGGDDAAACRDRATEVTRSWRRILRPLLLPEAARVVEVRVLFGEGPRAAALRQSDAVRFLAESVAAIDWHSQVTLHFDNCDNCDDGGARWERNGRRILVCDALLDRIEGVLADMD